MVILIWNFTLSDKYYFLILLQRSKIFYGNDHVSKYKLKISNRCFFFFYKKHLNFLSMVSIGELRPYYTLYGSRVEFIIHQNVEY